MVNKKILNLGCGKTYIKDAINVDFGEIKYCETNYEIKTQGIGY